jgi:predicted PurR-regulated permease PerM
LGLLPDQKISLSLNKKIMIKKYPLFFYTIFFLIAAFLVWYYSSIVIYMLIAAAISVVAQPLIKILKKIKVPGLLAVFITLLVIIGIFCSFFVLFVPLFIKEANMVSQLDFHHISKVFEEPLQGFETLLVQYDIIPKNENIVQFLSVKLESVFDVATFSNIIKSILNTTGKFMVGVFAVLFITFFFLKDENMFRRIVLALTRNKYVDRANNVIDKTQSLLQRYFIGLICDVLLMTTLMSVAMTIFGIHNSLLIGFFAGIVVVIPYIGPIIGSIVAVIIGVTSALALNIDIAIAPLVIKILAIYYALNVTDGMVFQPIIYGKVVKASPLEIFLVIMISGTTAGVVGMIIAVPTYTVLRIVAKEFLSQFKPVVQLTRDL